jgi:hypothetical protein
MTQAMSLSKDCHVLGDCFIGEVSQGVTMLPMIRSDAMLEVSRNGCLPCSLIVIRIEVTKSFGMVHLNGNIALAGI